jgi:prolyl-tRNA synthetase
MGLYGVGGSRAMAVIDEQHLDGLGLVWPREVAPAQVHIVAVAAKGGTGNEIPTALDIASQLEARGITTLVDDREGVSPGVRFKDAELLGMPTIVVIGKGLANGTVEVKDRRSGERSDVALADVVESLVTTIRG